MSREIKYKAWHKKEKRWIYLQCLKFQNGDILAWEYRLVDDVYQEYYYMPDDFELIQWTGLKDKNGKEIYEGDILEAQLYKSKVMRFAVEWKSISNHSSFGYGTHNIQVIGNIYENPELLKND